MRAKFGSDPTAGSNILSFKFISRCYMLCVYCCVAQQKEDHGTAFESDREGGDESLRNSFFQ